MEPQLKLDLEAPVGFPGRQYSMVMVTHQCSEFMGEDNRNSISGTSLDSVLPLTDFNMYTFPVINHNHEYNSFQRVL